MIFHDEEQQRSHKKPVSVRRPSSASLSRSFLLFNSVFENHYLFVSNAQKFLDTLTIEDQIDFIRKRLELHKFVAVTPAHRFPYSINSKALRKLERKRKVRDETPATDTEDGEPKRPPALFENDIEQLV